MEKIIFLTGQYLPSPGATGVCIHQIAKEAARRGYDVATVCYGDNNSYTIIDKVKVYSLKAPFFLNDTLIKKYKIIHLCSVFSKAFHLFDYPLRSQHLVNMYVKQVSCLIDNPDNTILVASVNPVEAVASLPVLKKRYPTIKAVYYCADTLSNERGNEGIIPSQIRSRLGLKTELEVFEYSDLVLIMDCHKNHYSSNTFQDYYSKMGYVNFPLLTQNENTEMNNKSSDNLKFVYAGTLYKTIRNPYYACQVLIDLCKNTNSECVFIGGGDCDEIIEKASLSTNNIKKLGILPHEITLQHIASADALISIGNKGTPMAPSKIYEYMSTGKPVIHFYFEDEDPCLEPLKRYGNAYLIKCNSQFDSKDIFNYVINTRQLSFREVSTIFNKSTPAYSLDLIIK